MTLAENPPKRSHHRGRRHRFGRRDRFGPVHGVEALHTLAAFNLVAQRSGRWTIVAATSLAVLSEMLGCAETIAARPAVHRAERAHYRQALRSVQPLNAGHTSDGAWTGPNTEGEAALELLERILGAKRTA